MTHGLPVADVESFKTNPKFDVHEFPVLLKTVLATNPHKGAFKNRALAKAMRTFFDKKEIVSEVYKSQADGLHADVPGAEPAGRPGDGHVGLRHQAAHRSREDLPASDKNARPRVLAKTRAARCPASPSCSGRSSQAAGFNVKVRGMPIAEVFDLPNHPEKAPDLLLWTFNPDAAHPDTWVRIFMNSKGAINYLVCSDPGADAAMDKGLAAVSRPTCRRTTAKPATCSRRRGASSPSPT